jgi:hypothetical protein
MKVGICVSTVSIVGTIDAYFFGTDKDVFDPSDTHYGGRY